MTGTKPRWQDNLKARIGNVRISSPLAFLVGLGLLGIPTFYTVLAPEFLKQSETTRIVVIVVWVVLALLVGLAALAKDRAWDELITEKHEQRRYTRLQAITDILDALLRSGTKDFPLEYEFTLYLFDGEQLRPYYPKRPNAVPDDWQGEDPRIFESGCGATGKAWGQDTTIEISGDAVSDASHGLREEQQTFFKDYRCVVATPVRVETRPVGVLTGLSKKEDHFFAVPASQAALRELADSVGVIVTYVAQPSDLAG